MGQPYHVVNRGNERRRLFFQTADYEGFVTLLAAGRARYPVEVFGLCLMPNHFHALVQPLSVGALSAYFQWVLGRYGCELRARTRTVGAGHVFQRRFWSDGILGDRRFLSVLRYVEANPVRAKLVTCATAWAWSSLTLRRDPETWLDPLPVALPAEWLRLVNAAQSYAELDAIRSPQERGRPSEAVREARDLPVE